VCRDPLRCFRCLENGHHARDCRNPWRPLSSLPCLATRPVSRHDIEHRHGPASCVSLLGSTPPSKALRSRSWASIVFAPASVPPSDVVLQAPLAAQVAQLQGCLVQVGRFLEQAEVALSRLSLLPAMMKASPLSCPPGEVNDDTEDRGDVLYGCFSPRVEDSLSSLSALPSVSSIVEDEPIDAVVPPVL
jgi:hypothetical protein